MAEETRFIVLAKSGGRSEPSAAGESPDVLGNFHDSLHEIAEHNGVTVNNAFAAQGSHDFVVDVSVDPEKFAAAHKGKNVAGARPEHIALGFAGALAQKAGVATQTLPVMPLDNEIFRRVFHTCTPPPS